MPPQGGISFTTHLLNGAWTQAQSIFAITRIDFKNLSVLNVSLLSSTEKTRVFPDPFSSLIHSQSKALRMNEL